MNESLPSASRQLKYCYGVYMAVATVVLMLAAYFFERCGSVPAELAIALDVLLFPLPQAARLFGLHGFSLPLTVVLIALNGFLWAVVIVTTIRIITKRRKDKG